jgi:23S rRNA pseudouridine2605 synthase
MASSSDFSSSEGERIAKFLARAGVCSRRDAEKLIAEGRVKLNGKTLDTPAVKVTAKDKISVDGRPVGAAEVTRLWRYHKPSGLVTTHRDPAGRPTVFENLPPDLPRVVSVGRLDLTSEGLLLLTNDGELARRLELPANGWIRRYRARAFGRVAQEELDQLKDGITVDGVRYGPVEAKLERGQGATSSANSWITVSITEGKNREVRRVLDALGLKVNRLIRIAYGPFQLGVLAPNAVEEIPRKVLREQLGKDFA